MPKRHQSNAAGGNSGWSIGSNGLTATGQSEILKDLGRQLQQNYREILREPAPDRIKQLLERLEQCRRHNEEENF
jgi:Anti-sigma factor NepR